ncbi:MAG TPA: FKBP-type peptidyl-prolyl cis-trans isomerase [Acidimicrobiales bacterium]|nr:FKBP-type peptidyl-prolyl cis-trans isomerase [Acidimicrobiales bacterium]
MGTEKRQRQKEGRQARIAAAQAAQQRSSRRRRYLTFVVMAIAVLGVFALINWLAGNHKSKTVSTAGSTTTSAPTTTLASAKGKPCVAMKGTPPKGAPTVPVQVGPPPTKLVVKDLKVGTGPAVKPTDTITVNYIGVACSTGKIFDSSWSRGTTATFGLNQVIQGWTKGLTGMQVGGRRLLGIPSTLGYGSQSAGPDIAPDEALWFVVDLVKITPPATTTTAVGSTTTSSASGSTTSTAATSTTK